MSRDAFLARVRQAAEIGRQYRVHINPFPPETGYVGVREDLCQRLAAEINAVGGEATLVSSLAAAREHVAKLLMEAHSRSALCWEHALLDRLGLTELLQSRGIAQQTFRSLCVLPPEEQRPKQLACDVGISSVDLAIAETGSLLLCSQPGHERTASLLPPFYIAIVERTQVVPDLLDAFAWLQSRGLENLPSNLALVTGPSKTGDIELQLTTGVHGPGRWSVVIVQ